LHEAELSRCIFESDFQSKALAPIFSTNIFQETCDMVETIPTAPISTTEQQSGPRGPDDVFRHLRTPVNMELNISFHPGGAASASPVAGAKDSLASALPEELMKRLRAMEPQLMKWLTRDENRLLFLSDPLAALQQIDKTLDKSFLKKLQRARQRLTPKVALDSRIRLAQVRVAVAEKPVTAVPRPARPGPKPPAR
jgi:hypothetical protein